MSGSPQPHRPFWISAFLDYPGAEFEAGVAFWSAVTGYGVSPPRGERGEFATLVAGSGDDYLRVQRLGDGERGIHVDLHVDDPRAAADRAVAAGAEEVDDRGYVVVRSPGGLLVCFVTHRAERQQPPARWGEGHRSRVRHVCLDAPADRFDAEGAFWSTVLEQPLGQAISDEFVRLNVSDEQIGGSGLLLQRLGEPHGRVRAHLDVGTDDRRAETTRHVALGARESGVHEWWTTMTDPVGAAYCIVDRL